jgi:hypothetical protein
MYALEKGMFATGTEKLPKENQNHINPRLSGGIREQGIWPGELWIVLTKGRLELLQYFLPLAPQLDPKYRDHIPQSVPNGVGKVFLKAGTF